MALVLSLTTVAVRALVFDAEPATRFALALAVPVPQSMTSGCGEAARVWAGALVVVVVARGRAVVGVVAFGRVVVVGAGAVVVVVGASVVVVVCGAAAGRVGGVVAG